MPAAPGQKVFDIVDGRDCDMLGIGGCLWGKRHIFKQRRGKRFRIRRDLE